MASSKACTPALFALTLLGCNSAGSLPAPPMAAQTPPARVPTVTAPAQAGSAVMGDAGQPAAPPVMPSVMSARAGQAGQNVAPPAGAAGTPLPPMAAGTGGAPAAAAAAAAGSSAIDPELGAGRTGPSQLPSVTGTCPELKDGMLTVAGTSLQLTVGAKPGPAYFYWHATTQHYDEVERALPKATSDTKTKGGLVASFEDTNRKGTNTGNDVWYTGDFDAADQLLACAIQKGIVDTTRIYTAGYSAGGIQACAMITTHGKYLASAICYSGSAAVISGAPQDKTHLPAVLLPHGAPGSDVLILDMAQQSVAWEGAYTAAGGFAIDCMDGGDHLTSAFTRMGLNGHAMEFLDAHTFGLKPEPYADGLPKGWPDYCKIVKK